MRTACRFPAITKAVSDVDEEAVLIYTAYGKDDDGFPVEQTEEVSVYVREKSATRTEFYEALRSNITVAEVFEIRQEDWNLTRHLTANGKIAYADRIRYDGATYDIVRAFKNDKSMIEVTCK